MTLVGDNSSTAESQTNGNDSKTNTYDGMGKKTITLTGQSWSTTVIVTIWKEFFALWEQRNNLVHGTDKSSHDLAKRSKAIAQIKHLHTQQNEVLAAHRSCMFMCDTEAELDSYLEP